MNNRTDVQLHELRAVLHDLSNALTGVLMNAGLLSLALRGNENLRRYADDISVTGERVAVLVRAASSLVAVPKAESCGVTAVTVACDSQRTSEPIC